MRFEFLGGADEVGASCTLVEIAERRILVDCGIRMGSSAQQTPTPALELLNGAKLDAIILTHAHMDHLGALPLVCALYPQVPVWMTPATLEIARIMLKDALKLQELWWEMGARVPLFGEQAVETFLASVRLVDFEEVVELVPGVRAAFYRAGHILGAACVLLESAHESVLCGGDISVAEQLTIPGVSLPAGVQPDVLVLESTYGGRLHAPREQELARLVEQAAQVLAAGGSVLYPSFAIGRAQEILLCLSRAQEEGKLPAVPIYVDGLVKSVCGVFRSHPKELTRWLKARVERCGNPFWGEQTQVSPVWSPADRDLVGKTGPCLIVASSGMLSGGPSLFYAQRLASSPLNLIAVTGYQDEESPGRRLLELAAAGGGELQVDGKAVLLSCKVATYNLSGHADMRELVGVAAALKPAHVVLVHGGGPAREALEGALVHGVGCRVHRPVLGAQLEIRGERTGMLAGRAQSSARRVKSAGAIRRAKPAPAARLAKASLPEAPLPAPRPASPPQSVEQLCDLASRLLKRDGSGKEYSTADLLLGWAGAGLAREVACYPRFEEALAQEGSPFVGDRHQRGIWRVRVDKQGIVLLKAAPQLQRALRRQAHQSQEHAREQVWQALQPYGLVGMKFKPAQQQITLQFLFARVDPARCAHVLEQLREETGWKLVVQSDYVHQQALLDRARDVLPAEWTPQGNPALHVEQGCVAIKAQASERDEARVEQVCGRFLQETGFALKVQLQLPLSLDEPVVVAAAPPGKQALEINKAYERIRHAFASQPHQPFKVGLKEGEIELAFISPQVGARYKELLTTLSQSTGYALRVRPQADQAKIRHWLEQQLQGRMTGFGFHAQAGSVEIALNALFEQEAWGRLLVEFEQATGLKLFLSKQK